jgi:hypothetical protein
MRRTNPLLSDGHALRLRNQLALLLVLPCPARVRLKVMMGRGTERGLPETWLALSSLNPSSPEDLEPNFLMARDAECMALLGDGPTNGGFVLRRQWRVPLKMAEAQVLQHLDPRIGEWAADCLLFEPVRTRVWSVKAAGQRRALLRVMVTRTSSESHSCFA